MNLIDLEDKEDLDRMILLQRANGSWGLEDSVCALLHVSVDAVKKGNPLKSEDAWATTLVLVWLTKFYSNKKDVWELLYEKAVQFLEGDKGSMSLQQLLTAAKKFLHIL